MNLKTGLTILASYIFAEEIVYQTITRLHLTDNPVVIALCVIVVPIVVGAVWFYYKK